MINDDIASHYGLTSIGFCTFKAFAAETLNSFAEYVDGFCGSVATAIFFESNGGQQRGEAEEPRCRDHPATRRRNGGANAVVLRSRRSSDLRLGESRRPLARLR